MKGHKDHEAAAIEAEQEAGLVGRIHKKPIGTYTYWKRRADPGTTTSENTASKPSSGSPIRKRWPSDQAPVRREHL